MLITEALGLGNKELISLVGGGGKTTLMFALARELYLKGKMVISTTTTKILEPTFEETNLLIVEKNEEIITDLCREKILRYWHITLASERVNSGKLKGLNPDLINKLFVEEVAPYIINEADGSAQHSLKAPNATEPVIPVNTTLVVAVVGIEVVGRTLTEENVFRSEIASKLLNLPVNSRLTEEVVAKLITHTQGITKGSPLTARIIPFINKVDSIKDATAGRSLAKRILDQAFPQIKQVVLGRARFTDPIVDIIHS